jgi:hypothetical protein
MFSLKGDAILSMSVSCVFQRRFSTAGPSALLG